MSDAPPPKPTSSNAPQSGIVVPNNPRWYQRLAALLIWLVANTVAATVRFRLHDPHGVLKRSDLGPAIYCAWHNRLALSIKLYRLYSLARFKPVGMAALVSASKDGALLAEIFRRFGLQPVRGSSSRRGAQALLELSTWAERGYDIAITPDGPRGPKYHVAGGTMTLAQFTGLPIIPISYSTRWKIKLKSWDTFQIPLPFTRCDVHVGSFRYVPREISDDDREALRLELQAELHSITQD